MKNTHIPVRCCCCCYCCCCCCCCCCSSHINSSPQYNAVRGHRTGSNNSGVEELRRQIIVHMTTEAHLSVKTLKGGSAHRVRTWQIHAVLCTNRHRNRDNHIRPREHTDRIKISTRRRIIESKSRKSQISKWRCEARVVSRRALCLFFQYKNLFLLFDIQHNQCPRRFFDFQRDTSSVVTKPRNRKDTTLPRIRTVGRGIPVDGVAMVIRTALWEY